MKARISLGAIVIALSTSCVTRNRVPDECGEMIGIWTGYMTAPTKTLVLPGAEHGAALSDAAFEPSSSRVWIAAGDLGSVYAIDTATFSVTRVDGFGVSGTNAATTRAERGPSTIAIGAGLVYVGNTATSEICSVDAASAKIVACTKTTAPPGELGYDRVRRELWAALPASGSIVVFDASRAELAPAATIAVGGTTVGHAFGPKGSSFVTFLADTGSLLWFDPSTHELRYTAPLCTKSGGFVDMASGGKWTVVACKHATEWLESRHPDRADGNLSESDARGRIAFLAEREFVYRVGHGRLSVTQGIKSGGKREVYVAPLPETARTVVADPNAVAYVLDPASGRVLVFDVVKSSALCTATSYGYDCLPHPVPEPDR